MSFSKMPTLIKQNRQKEINKRPKSPLPINLSSLYDAPPVDKTKLEFCWYGHSVLKLHMNGLHILIDPQLNNYASPVPGTVTRFSDMSSIDWDRIPDIDLVVFSHDHYDHLDYNSLKKLKSKTDHFLVSLGMRSHLEYWGVDSDKITECDWHEKFEYKGLRFEARPNKHFSGRAPKTRNSTLWCGWVIASSSHKVYFSSDSGFFHGFRDTGELHGPFDLCFVECGQYNTLWKENHMMPEESLQAFIDLKGKWMVPIHWGGFSLAPHDWREPMERLFNAADQRALTDKIISPGLGQKIVFGKDFPKAKWWQDHE